MQTENDFSGLQSVAYYRKRDGYLDSTTPEEATYIKSRKNAWEFIWSHNIVVTPAGGGKMRVEASNFALNSTVEPDMIEAGFKSDDLPK